MLKLLHKAMKNTSDTNWDKLEALSETEIDTSDIPPLTDEFFNKSRWWKQVVPTTRLKLVVFDINA